jgi:hypothetical protein
MNAFMVWSQTRRQSISQKLPKMHNKEISKILGLEWKSMSEAEKGPFKDEAQDISAKHKEANPGYRYQPKRKQKKPNNVHDVNMFTSYNGAFVHGHFNGMEPYRQLTAGQTWMHPAHQWAVAGAYKQAAPNSPFPPAAFNASLATAKNYTAIAMPGKLPPPAHQTLPLGWDMATAQAGAQTTWGNIQAVRNRLFNGSNLESNPAQVGNATAPWSDAPMMVHAAQAAQGIVQFPFMGGYPAQSPKEEGQL